MRIDEQVVHADDIQPGSGAEFFGTPIREMNLIDVDVREALDAQRRARVGLGVETPSIELLPGEVIRGNIIRRETTAEVVGEQFYEASTEQGIADLRPPDYWGNYYSQREAS